MELAKRGSLSKRARWLVCLVAIIALPVVANLVISAILRSSRPNPKTDYLAQLNAMMPTAALEDQAWPIYRRAWIADYPGHLNVSLVIDDNLLARPDDPKWSDVATLLTAHHGLLEAAWEARHKPVFGLVRHLRPQDYAPEDRLALWGSKGPPPALPGHTPMLSIDLPVNEQGLLRRTARLVAMDMQLAAARNDSSRVLQDAMTLLAMAKHAREFPIIINMLLAGKVHDLANQTIANILYVRAQSITTPDLEQLAQLTAAGAALALPDFRADLPLCQDTIQRFFTDDGQGNGRLDFNAARTMAFAFSGDGPDFKAMARYVSPGLQIIKAPSRRVMDSELRRLIELEQSQASLPLWEARARPEEMPREEPGQYDPPLRMWLGLMGHTNLRAVRLLLACRRGRIDALRVAIALELYRREHGHFPQTLSDLVGQYLPEPPLDHSTGQPMLYKLADGRPLLYGRGADGDDDGGVVEPSPRVIGDLPASGDWVLYPQPADPEAQQAHP